MIQIEKQHVGKYLVFRLSGTPGKDDVELVKQQLLSSVNESPHPVIDLGYLSSLPNYLMIPLIMMKNSLSHGSVLTLINTPSDFHFMLQLAKIDSLFEFVPSLETIQEESPVVRTDDPPPIPSRPVIKDVIQRVNQRDE